MPGQGDRLFMLAAVTAGLGLLTWLSALYRERLDRRDAELTRDLERLATTDDLTGCLNRRAFAERLAAEIARADRYGTPLSLVIADVDRFKELNDTSGHAVGDAALALAGEVLRTGSRQTDLAARIGGDEFTLLLPGTSLEAAGWQAQRIFDPEGRGVGRLTFSAGVASVDETVRTADDLFREADRALYHVKRTGGRGVALATPLGEPRRQPPCEAQALTAGDRHQQDGEPTAPPSRLR